MKWTLQAAGAVAAVKGIKNPVRLARAVMDKSRNVLLIADGAMEFARENNIPSMPVEYFLTEDRRLQWEKATKENAVTLDHNSSQAVSTTGIGEHFFKNSSCENNF